MRPQVDRKYTRASTQVEGAKRTRKLKLIVKGET
jgi:hypothetical protein